MYRRVILLCIVAIWLHSVTGTDAPTKTTITTPVPAPSQLQYSCELSQNDLTITINSDVGPAHFKTFWAVGNTDDNGRGNCSFHRDVMPIKISGCKADKPVDIIIAETQISEFPDTIDKRYSTYRLVCYSGSVSPHAPFAVIRNKDINGGDPNAEEYEIAGLTLTVEKKHKDEKPIMVGDALVIEIKGPAILFYKALSCNASKASDTTKKIELIKNSKLIIGESMETLSDKQPMNTTTCTDSGTNKCVTADIRAFHFVDDNRVIFTCSIQVCGSQCAKRRKRGTDITDLNVRDLQTTVTVHDRLRYPLDKEANDACTIHHLSWMVAGATILAVTRYW